jgi:hypothetical protein
MNRWDNFTLDELRALQFAIERVHRVELAQISEQLWSELDKAIRLRQKLVS